MASSRGGLPAYTLIGDLVGSRDAVDRQELQRGLRRALEEVGQELEHFAPLEPTIGDEFQGSFDSPAVAARASLMLRLELLQSTGVDSRYGLGGGTIDVFDRSTPVSQDGPGWWAARAAIMRAESLASERQTAFARTYFLVDRTGQKQTIESTMNAFLLCRDEIVDRMKQPNRNRLYGLMRGWSQARIAAEEGTTQGAISQSLSRSGAFAIVAAQELLDRDFE